MEMVEYVIVTLFKQSNARMLLFWHPFFAIHLGVINRQFVYVFLLHVSSEDFCNSNFMSSYYMDLSLCDVDVSLANMGAVYAVGMQCLMMLSSFAKHGLMCLNCCRCVSGQYGCTGLPN